MSELVKQFNYCYGTNMHFAEATIQYYGHEIIWIYYETTKFITFITKKRR